MKRKLLLLFLTVIMATCFVCGLTSVAFAAENNCGCTIATARDDGEGEYRVHLSGEGITDGSFDDTKIKINDKTITNKVLKIFLFFSILHHSFRIFLIFFIII